MIRVLATTSLIFFLTSCLMGKLYVESQKELTSLETLKNNLIVDLDECGKSKDKLIESFKQDDSLIEKKETVINQLNKEKDKNLNTLSNLKSKKCNIKEVINEIDIDDRLPVELIQLLNQAHKRNEGSTNPSP